ncbi:hypothetical protein BOTBODRAFT_114271 [Botryobasidium botryosum FD-172 SS1]|uniref:Tudor domain-containing protein n=1 Tax=Botryobasidium botryosum (strain FD-172 SS1) TaxID=930990 RepID=A0A067M730_BOTB1|nr:hypothetical protein BOTBODRAFT_114271 [Botryobasidium botryosum FD-172 SS1]
MDRKELETYQVQLSQVELALDADPSNAELTSLRDELKELITLTETALAQIEGAAASASTSSTKPKPSADSHSRKSNPASSAQVFAAGDECLAKYSGDGAWYPARITSIGGSEGNWVYSVAFKGYNTTELVPANGLKPLPPNSQHAGLSSSKRKMSKEEEDDRERKKKKNEKKLETRAAKAKEQNNKQQAWQKFAKKGEKKGIHIAGIQGSSIFKTPDNPHGRVGVTGSGKGMTEYATRNKHKFTQGEDS